MKMFTIGKHIFSVYFLTVFLVAGKMIFCRQSFAMSILSIRLSGHLSSSSDASPKAEQMYNIVLYRMYKIGIVSSTLWISPRVFSFLGQHRNQYSLAW